MAILFYTIVVIVGIALVYGGLRESFTRVRRIRMTNEQGEQDRMFLIGELQALDDLVGAGSMVWTREQSLEQRIGGMYPIVTLYPADGAPAYNVALLPMVFEQLNGMSGGVVTLEEEEEILK